MQSVHCILCARQCCCTKRVANAGACRPFVRSPHPLPSALAIRPSQAMAADPNFIRLSKGAYSLHCLHPDKEQLVRAPQPKKRKLEELGEHAGLWL